MPDQYSLLLSVVKKLAVRVTALEERVAAPAPEVPERWDIWARERQKVVFRSSKGRLERLPTTIVELLARGEPLDCDIKEGPGEMIRFVLPNGKAADQIPRTLAAVLDGQHLLRNWQC